MAGPVWNVSPAKPVVSTPRGPRLLAAAPRGRRRSPPRRGEAAASPAAGADGDAAWDVVVVGAGLAGLSCAALLADAGRRVLVLEAHDAPGGAAHGWERRGYRFESGPSLYSGLAPAPPGPPTRPPSSNPLRHVLDVVDAEAHGLRWARYDRWGTALPEGRFAARVGPADFAAALRAHGGPRAERDWASLLDATVGRGGLSAAAQALPAFALREDAGVLRTAAAAFPRRAWATLARGRALSAPFGEVLRSSTPPRTGRGRTSTTSGRRRSARPTPWP